MIPISKTSCLQQSPRTLTRRAWLGASCIVVTGLALRSISKSLSYVADDKEKALAMLDQKIEELKKSSKEKEVVELLELFRKEFLENGEVNGEQPYPAVTMYNLGEENGEVVLRGTSPVMQPGFINANWNNRNIPHVIESFVSGCLKEAVYFGEYKKNPAIVINKIKAQHDFAKEINRLSSKATTKELFIKLAQNSDVVESAKQYIASLTHWEFMGYKVQLEFLHRQGWDANVCEKMKKDKAIYRNDFLRNSFLQNLGRMGFVSQEGVLDEGNFLRTVVKDMFLTSEEQHDPQNRLFDNYSRSAFHIILASQAEYRNAPDVLELFDKKANLFDFIYDEKYWKVN